MKTYISMLRGINVSGQNKIRMEELREYYESLAFKNVRTYLQSGNVIFETIGMDEAILGFQIVEVVQKCFGFSVQVFIRRPEDFERILTQNPFLREDTSQLYVTFLHQFPTQEASSGLKIPENSLDQFSIGEREIFLFCPSSYGKTKLNNNFFERKLNLAATTRNWNTVKALYGMACGEL